MIAAVYEHFTPKILRLVRNYPKIAAGDIKYNQRKVIK